MKTIIIKNKYTFVNILYLAFVGGEFMRPEPITTAVVSQKLQQQPQIFDINLLNEASKPKLQKQLLHTTEHMNPINIAECSKPLSQLNQQQQQQPPPQQLQQHQQQSPFMPSLNQEIPSHSQQTSLDDLAKAYNNATNKADSASQLCERNDIFLSDKTWAGVPKVPDQKDSIASGADKLEPDENAGFGDILGGFGEGDDDDILKSLTAEIGDDFNILEYADPELDEINGSQNLLNKLDFDENQKAI